MNTEKEFKVDLLWIPNLFILPLLIWWVLLFFAFTPSYWDCFLLNLFVRLIISPPEIYIKWFENS